MNALINTSMNAWNPKLWRAALRLEEAYRDAHGQQRSFALPELAWTELRKSSTRLSIAKSRDWRRAVERERVAAAAELEHLRDMLGDLGRVLRASVHKTLPTVRTLYDELTAVASEFDDVKIEGNALCATTESIVLEDVRLGSFEIRLDLKQIGAKAYSVVALEPNPAASSSDTTHPHVANDKLCSGEGRPAINAALDEGRLLDFFTVVDRVLHTYSPDSAFVDLERWFGVPCSDCDCLLDDDASYVCDRCDAALCGDCLICCGACSEGFCASCIDTCAVCDERCCRGCLANCGRCRRDVCPSCLDDELCNECREEQQDDDEDIPNETSVETNASTKSAI